MRGVGLRVGVLAVSVFCGLACAEGAPDDGGADDAGITPLAFPFDAGGDDAPDAAEEAGPPPRPDAAGDDEDAGSEPDAGVDSGPPPPSGPCFDTMKNGFETGTDCGGPDCDPCPESQGCIVERDCESGLVCEQGICTCTVDSDGDGVNDCDDECPRDPVRSEPGTCGCVGKPDPTPAGTPCDDGVCPLPGNTCDGLGTCGNASACEPPATGNCGDVMAHADHIYFFCTGPFDWSTAQSACTAAGYVLARVDTMEENDFLAAGSSGDLWLGGRDSAAEMTWVWTDGEQFSMGSTATGGLYTRWASGEPNDSGTQDCLKLYGPSAGEPGFWDDDDCDGSHGFVCEGD